MSARFRIDDTFRLTGRGLVIAGEILEGKVKIGMRCRVAGAELTVGGIEMIHRSTPVPEGKVAVMVGEPSADQLAALVQGLVLELS